MTIVRTRPLLALLCLMMVCLGSIVLHELGYLAATERFVVQFIAPLQQGVSSVVRAAQSLHLGLADMQRLRRENEELRAEVERLRSLAIGLKEAQDENRLLRDELGFSQMNPAYDLLPAQVIGRDTDNYIQTISIDKGTRDGVREGKVVVAAGRVSLPVGQAGQQQSQDLMVVQGLVGRVIEAGPNYARVLLITDASSATNVFVQGTQAEGLIEGLGRGKMELRYVRQGEQIMPGEVALTSGLGGMFPRGLAVGILTSVETKDQATFQTASTVPIVDFSRLNIVFVIRSFDPIWVGR